ncbi:MAG TPA: tRNA preQ1(34) S-adenosylmethionine ribosyltransferase-isomerase QueA [Thermoanaerobaculia bacterium]|nr:tRNA preQ1(34) S-adenosylmethionine ribosyltransferase-isomerase QueA [Thermoanaerobaculia bacterium]
MRVDLFDYFLPADRIAQQPRDRGTSRLLVLDRRTGQISHRSFAEFPALLEPGDLLVRNDVRVFPARLYGRDPNGRLVELLLLTARDTERRRWLALSRPGRRAKVGRNIHFEEGITARVESIVDGQREVLFDQPLSPPLLERLGHVPLPPYIRRGGGAPDRAEDREAYQTVYAREPLAVAAPTAGLHFTSQVLSQIREKRVAIADLTLAVGAGTFKPVTVEEIEDHRLDPEGVSFPGLTAAGIAETKGRRGRVIAVGTTVTRALEAAVRQPGGFDVSAGRRFDTDLFITPGFEFRVVDALLTNFHLPRSTLLMLVCAFAGRDRVLAAYAEAIRQGYLFYSYGDAMFIA